MKKKLHLLLFAVLILGFQTTKAQVSNIPEGSTFNFDEVASNVARIVAENGTTTRGGGAIALNYVQDAFGPDLNALLTSSGFSVTDDFGSGNLDVLLPSQAWTIVILQVHNIDLSPNEVTAISNYISGGGLLIMSYWDLSIDPALQTIIGVSNTISFSDPLPISIWDAAHPIFTTPNTIGDFVSTGDAGGADNGDRLEPDTGAIAVAGFVGSPTTNEAAIIIANSNTTIFHGFAGLDFDLTEFLNLVENEIEFLINTLSVTDTDFGPSLSVFPNPTVDGNISINLGATYQDVKVTVQNILGQTLDIQTFSSVNKINNFYINGTSGTYFINIQTKDGKSAVIKVLKK